MGTTLAASQIAEHVAVSLDALPHEHCTSFVAQIVEMQHFLDQRNAKLPDCADIFGSAARELSP